MLYVSQVPGIVICDTYGNSQEFDGEVTHDAESSRPFVIPYNVSQSIVQHVPRGHHGCPDALLRCLPAEDEFTVLPYVSLEAPLKVKRLPLALKPTLPEVSRCEHAAINIAREGKATAVVTERYSFGETNTNNVDGEPNTHISSSDDMSCWETLNAISPACASSGSVEYDCGSPGIERDTEDSINHSRYPLQVRTCEQCDESKPPIAGFLPKKRRNSGMHRTETVVDGYSKDTSVATNVCTMHNDSCFIRDEYTAAVTSECGVERNNNDTSDMTSLAYADPGSVISHIPLHAITSSALDLPAFTAPSTCTRNYSRSFTSTTGLRAFNNCQQGKYNNSDDVRNSHASRELITEATAKTVVVKDNQMGHIPRGVSHKETVLRRKNGIRISQSVTTETELFDKKLTIYFRGRHRSSSPRDRKQLERKFDTQSQPGASV